MQLSYHRINPAEFLSNKEKYPNDQCKKISFGVFSEPDLFCFGFNPFLAHAEGTECDTFVNSLGKC